VVQLPRKKTFQVHIHPIRFPFTLKYVPLSWAQKSSRCGRARKPWKKKKETNHCNLHGDIN